MMYQFGKSFKYILDSKFRNCCRFKGLQFNESHANQFIKRTSLSTRAITKDLSTEHLVNSLKNFSHPRSPLYFNQIAPNTNNGLCKFFHTSSPRKLHPLVVLVLRPLGKVAAVLVGRGFRKWWKSLPKDKRRLFFHHVERNKWKYFASFILVGGISYSLYATHVDTVPYTGRKRVLIFDTNQLATISEFSFHAEAEEMKNLFLPDTHPDVVRTKRICAKLLRGNRDLPEIYTKYWTVYVVDTPEENCRVFPTGQIIMNTGMLELADNDDQIAMIVAHEISHVILEHSAEQFSHATLLDILIVVPLALIWALLPNDGIAVVADWFFKRVVETLVHLPYSRKLEKEADAAGIFIAASACFDVREASAFWGRLSLIEKKRSLAADDANEHGEIAFLSTHPTHLERQSHLDELMTGALKTREDKKCPRLRKPDPRESVWATQQHYGTIAEDKKLALVTKSLQMSKNIPAIESKS